MKAIAIYISAVLVLTSNICGESFANSSKATTMQRNQIDQILNKADDRLARLDTNAIQLLNKANSMLRGANINALQYRISLAYGNYYKIKKEFKLSAENYYRALELSSDTRQKVNAMIAIAELNRSNCTYHQGIRILNNAMNIIRHEAQFATEKARIYDRLAAINYELTFTPYTKNIFHPLNIAIAYADSAIAIAKPLDYDIRISSHNIRGAANIHLKHFPASEESFAIAMNIMEMHPDSAFTDYNYQNILLNYAGLYFAWGKYHDVIRIANQAIEDSRKRGNHTDPSLLYTILVDTYDKLKDYQNAYKYLRLKCDNYTQDKFFAQQRAVQDLDIKYDTKHKQSIINQQKKINTIQNIAIVAGLIILIAIVIISRSRQKAINEMNRITTLRNDELTAMNNTKDKFLSIIAHDLKNPIHSIHSLISYIAMDHTEMESEDLKYNLDVLEKNSKNVAQLLENLLTWARSQSGKITYTPMELSINAIINNSIDIANIQAHEKSITLNYNNSISDEVLVQADSNTLITVFRNILSNAIKFTPDNGNINISAEEDDRFVTISISDSGVGIPEDKLPTIFDIDRNYSSKGTNQELGTGLGLILCREFVEKNGGTIWADSQIGVGSTFSFTIPKAQS